MAQYFPSLFDNASVKEYYEKLKIRTLILLESIVKSSDGKDKIKKIDDFLLTFSKPTLFWGRDNAEIRYDKQFEDMCLVLSKELGVDSKSMTVLQFYNGFDYIKKQNA